MKTNLLFEQLIKKQDLSSQQMQEFLHDCLSGAFSDVHIATFLALMRMKGETADELTAAAQVLQKLAHKIDLGSDFIDIVGTGGDSKNTFNVSTASSFVVAAAGIPVAKHGNRSVSSNSGSADLLEKAGFMLFLNDKAIKTCLQQCKLAFLFAPHYHKALQKVRAARQQLGIRTFFNLLGPMINPAQAKRQVVGVFDASWLDALSLVLSSLGSNRHLVISSKDGMDEISIAANTQVLEYKDGVRSKWLIKPEDYGLKHNHITDITVNSPEQSLLLIKDVFAGTKGAARDMVLLNSAAAIYCAKDDLSFEKAIEEATNAIDSGKAATCFEQLRSLTRTLHTDNSNE